MKRRLFVMSLSIILGLLIPAFVIVATQANTPTSTVGWRQANTDGFGLPENVGILSLASFGDFLYAGTYNLVFGGEIWRSRDGFEWNQVITGGLGVTNNTGIDELTEFNGSFFASTWADASTGAEIWGSPDGLNWTPVITPGFGDVNNEEIFGLIKFKSKLYATTLNLSTGTEVWVSPNGTTWQQDNEDGFGDTGNTFVGGLIVNSDNLYAGVSNSSGAEIWKTEGATWTLVPGGPGNTADNLTIGSMVNFNGFIYAVTVNLSTGSQIWRTQDFVEWTRVMDDGFGKPASTRAPGLVVYNSQLYCVVGDINSGAEVWRTKDGVNWVQVGFGGWGDLENSRSYWDHAIDIFDDQLFMGTVRPDVGGGEIWMYLPYDVFLPVVTK
jgi:hypothetical protein